MNVEARIDYAPVGSTPQIDHIWVQACVKEAAEEGALNYCPWKKSVFGMNGSPIPHTAWAWVNIHPGRNKLGSFLCLLEEDDHLMNYSPRERGVLTLFACQIAPTSDGPLRTVRAVEEHLASRYGVETVDWEKSVYLNWSKSNHWSYSNTTVITLPSLTNECAPNR
jgi:hypothetical protein